MKNLFSIAKVQKKLTTFYFFSLRHEEHSRSMSVALKRYIAQGQVFTGDIIVLFASG